MANKEIIPVFFAADECYTPFLAVALTSIKKYASADRQYQIHVLCTGIDEEKQKSVLAMQTENIKIRFENISEKASQIYDVMRCRDYYTSAIYYRLFIPDLFPQYDKAIYLDCDTVLLEDIAILFDKEIGDNFIGAVADQAVSAVPQFREYTKNALDVDAEEYFNSGVIVLNLKQLRAIDFYKTFYGILSSYDFTVAPDQDCLNLICKGKVYFYGAEWNRMPIGGVTDNPPKLIHYNLAMKPWHYDGVLYEEYFWEFAKQTEYYEVILAQKQAFTPEMAERDRVGGEKLIALAKSEADNPNNYIRTQRKIKSK
ncbi:MAG: glycosyltransferase family 8 protein [Clostridiales bacterium]|nr:glycosyltransferase family 8 protein [Clostridiales bacterium]